MDFEILDCTLRDGGYTNNWQFSQEDIFKIINSLINSGIEKIECGYLSKNEITNSTKLNSIEKFDLILNSIDKKNSKFYLMTDFNDYDTNLLINQSNFCIDGIRLAFHKKDLNNIFSQAKNIKAQGYELFIQPMAIQDYSDSDLKNLFSISLDLKADAVYIVDSFGCLEYYDLEKIFLKYGDISDKIFYIGLHLHNNLHTAFSNAINLINHPSAFKHKLIIDTSITGLGRGSGNIKTEFVSVMFEKLKNYNSLEIIKLMDRLEIFNNQSSKKDLAYFLSAVNKTHPSKAIYALEEYSNTFNIYNYLMKEII